MIIGKKIHAQLTGPFTGETIQLGSIQPVSMEAKVTVANINTNVTLQYDYSNDNFTTVAASSELHTFTANGTRTIPLSVGYAQVRPVFSSESGGTNVTLDIETSYYSN